MYSWSEVRPTGATKHFAKKQYNEPVRTRCKCMQSLRKVSKDAIVSSAGKHITGVKTARNQCRSRENLKPVSSAGKLIVL